MKTCLACHRKKPASRFYKRAASPDGRHYYCVPCVRKRNVGSYSANRQARVEYQARWRSKNRKKSLEQKREYYQRNRRNILAAAAAYREENWEAIRKDQRRRRRVRRAVRMREKSRVKPRQKPSARSKRRGSLKRERAGARRGR